MWFWTTGRNNEEECFRWYFFELVIKVSLGTPLGLTITGLLCFEQRGFQSLIRKYIINAVFANNLACGQTVHTTWNRGGSIDGVVVIPRLCHILPFSGEGQADCHKDGKGR